MGRSPSARQSAPVNTASTPAMARACVVSMRTNSRVRMWRADHDRPRLPRHVEVVAEASLAGQQTKIFFTEHGAADLVEFACIQLVHFSTCSAAFPADAPECVGGQTVPRYFAGATLRTGVSGVSAAPSTCKRVLAVLCPLPGDGIARKGLPSIRPVAE